MALGQPGSLIGKTIGNFVVEKKVGEGGMGEVYVAAHPRLNRKVAVKVLHAAAGARPELARRFYNEARAANDVKSPHIVEVLDFGELADGVPYLVMEWLNGRSLGDVLVDGRRVDVGQAVHVLEQTCSALSAAHAVRIIHRDLKPDNIFLIEHQGDPNYVKVLDFGIAKLAGDDQDVLKTTTGVLMGTPAYMSPEQCRGLKTLDNRSDIYSLGVIAFQMLTGRLPFEAEGWGDLILMHVNAPPPHPCELVPELPKEVGLAVLQALQKNPSDRFATASDFAAALRGAAPATAGSVLVAARSQPKTMPLLKPTALLPVGDARTGAPHATPSRSHTTLEGRELEGRTRSSASRTWVLAAVVATAVTGAAVGLFWPRQKQRSLEPTTNAAMQPAHDPPVVRPPAPAAEQPRQVRLTVRTAPADARVRLDDEELAKPVDQVLPRTQRSHRLTVSAPRHRTVERTIVMDASQDLFIELEPVSPPRTPAPTKSKPTAGAPGPRELSGETPRAPVVQAPPAAPAPPAPAAEPPPASRDIPAPGRPVYRGTRLPLEKDF